MGDSVDCVVAGHICLDMAPQFQTAGGTVAEVFRPGKLINVGPMSFCTGGPVSNTGLPLARLGVRVKLMGKCGDDVFGRTILEILRREAPGAEEGMQLVPGEKTSYSVVLNVPGLDRMFLHCTGANDTFASGDVDPKAVARARLFHFGYPPLMARMYADGGRELVEVFRQAKAAGATTSLDLALPDPAGPSGKVDWTRILSAVMPDVDIFTPSVEELTFMLRRKLFDELADRAGGGDLLGQIDGELLDELGERCLGAGAGVVLIKCGYLGQYLRTAGAGRLERFGRCRLAVTNAWVNRELFMPGYRVENVVSATGAGDCAIAGFLAGVLRGGSPEDALRYACAVGAQNVQAADSISGVRSWDETVRQVAARPPQHPLSIPMPRWRQADGADQCVGPRDGNV